MALTNLEKNIGFWKGYKVDYTALKNENKLSNNTVYFVLSDDDSIGEIYIDGKMAANISDTSKVDISIIDCGGADNTNKPSIKLRGDTKNNWETINPILLENELVIETDSLMMKVGDGSTSYSELEYISGGGSGGGSSRPIIESTFDTKYCKTDESIELTYSLSSPNYGLCKAYYFIDNAMTTINPVSVEQGENTWVVGKLSKGEHTLKMYVIDAGNLYSNTLHFKIISGSLELISSYSDENQYAPSDNIVIDFFIDSVFKDKSIKLYKKISYGITTDTIEEEYLGSQSIKWDIKDIVNGRLGVFKVRIYAETIEENPILSNTLAYTIIVGSSDSLFISTDINNEAIYTNDDIISIPYRISMKGVTYFKSEVLINGEKTVLNSKYGSNYWQIGKLPIGKYSLSLQAFTEDYSTESNIIELNINVEQASDIDVEPTPSELMNLVGWFDASMMSNSYPESSDGGNGPFRNIWTDKSGNKTKLELFDVGYTDVNGWVNNSLKLNGESYAVINLNPLANNVPNGMCIDITFKSFNVGVESGRVLSCESDEGYGVHIQPSQANITSSKRDLVSYFSENEWTRITLMINRSERLMYTYINGTFSDVSNIDDTSEDKDNFIVDNKIYLNCRKIKEKYSDFGSCEIKNIRIYSRPIERNTVVRNYIYDIEDTEYKKHVYKMNYEQSYALPVLRVIGDLSEMTKDKRVTVTAVYDGKGGEFGEPFELDSCQLSWQGTSSLVYPVKNLKIRLGYINSLGVREKVPYSPLPTWNSESTFTLKTDYMESGHTNNTGTAKIVNGMYNEKVPPQYIDSNIRTAIDGFPIAMYNDKPDGNGGVVSEYMGVFMFNIDKGADKCFGFDRKKWANNLSYEISANSDIGAGAFRTDDIEAISRELEIRFPDEADTWTDHSKIKRLITWVKNSSDSEFKADFEKYLNKDYTIKYYVMVLTLGMIDSLGKNMMMNTWDGLIWYPSFYDMDTMLGLDNTGQIRIPVDAEMKAGLWNTSNSLLWVKLQRNFDKEIKTLYYELRGQGKRLHYDELIKIYKGEIVDNIAQKYYNDDAYTKYIYNEDGRNKYLYACHGSRLEFTKKWLRERLIFMDTLMGYTGSDVHIECSFRANKQGKVTLRLKTYTPMYITVNFSNTSGAQLTYLCSPDKYTDYEWNLLTATDQEINITGAPHLKEIDGLKDFRPSTILFEKATKLTSIDCSDSLYLKQATLNGMTNLRYVNFSNCSNLGTLVGGDTVINVSSCPNLKTLLLNNTQITGVTLLNGGGYKDIDVSSTRIREFKVSNMAYLDSIGISMCANLDTVEISNCRKIKTLNMSSNKASNVSIVRCDNISTVNLNNNSGLTYLDISNCPNLANLSLSGITNKTFNEVNLENCKSIETLDISDSKYINTIIFDKFETSDSALKSFRANGSGIRLFKYGSDYITLGGIDFIKMPLMETINLNYCEDVEYVKNLNIVNNGNVNFYRCEKLKSVTGNIKLGGDISNMFSNCTLIEEYPTMDLSEVTSARNAFSFNPNMDSLSAFNIMQSFSDKLVDISDIFYGNRNINDIYDDFFINTPNIRNVSGAFRSTGVTSIPNDLFAPLGERLTNVSSCFAYSRLSNITDDIFITNTYLTNVTSCFENCIYLVSIPQNIFINNINITTASKCFIGCSSASLILNKAFMDNIKNVWDINSMFENCNNIVGSNDDESLSGDIFDSCIELRNIASTLRGCYKIKGAIPIGLLKNNKKVTNVSSFLENCSNLTGSIPEDLLNDMATEDGLSQLGNCSNILAGCYNLTGSIPERFFDKTPSLTNISNSFYNCTKLSGNIPPTLLHKLPSLMEADNLFKNCTLISGNIPSVLLEKNINLRSINGIFNNCIGLVGSIPSDLFINNKSLYQASNIFNGCENLSSSIPTTLFAQNGELASLNSSFKNCKNLDNFSPTSFIEDSFFENNPNLVDIGGIFSNTSFYGSIPTLLFSPLRRVENISELFYNSNLINGAINTSIFQNCSNLKNVSRAFMNTSISNIGTDSDAIFKIRYNPNIELFESTFNNCTELTYAPNFWGVYSEAKGGGCFSNCILASNYTEIPSGWK